MKQLVAGILAHVDAGKTTLSEGILYQAGSIRKLGRVDHKDAYLDTDAQERSRGITIFSKPAQLRFREMDLTLIDTPGHVDFSAEMERTLQVLDCAVLVISGTDGVQGHTETLWRLLAHHRIPTFVFVNKMDLSGADRELRLLNLKSRLSDSCIDFSGRTAESFYEELALCSEELLEEYMERGRQETSSIASAIKKRLVFPVFFGSALKLDGVDRLLDGIEKYCPENEYPEEFGAKVYKIGRDDQGKRLTWMKITGGRLCVRELLSSEKNGTPAGGGQNRAENAERDGLSGGSGSKNRAENAGWNGLSGENSGQNRAENAERDGLSGGSGGKNRAVNAGKDSLPGRAGLRRSDGDTVKEKVDQIRIYNGAKYRAVDCAPAGTICAVTGLTHTCPGQGFGAEPPSGPPLSVPVMTWLANAAIFNLIAMLVSNKAHSAVVSILLAFGLLFLAIYIFQMLSQPEMVEDWMMSAGDTEWTKRVVKNLRYVSGWKRKFYEFLIDFLPSGQGIQLASFAEAHAYRMAGCSVALIAVSHIAGSRIFHNKNIK